VEPPESAPGVPSGTDQDWPGDLGAARLSSLAVGPYRRAYS